MPYHEYGSMAEFTLPQECQLVGIELTEESIELPSFRHPVRAAYVLGPEMGHLSPEMQDRCARACNPRACKSGIPLQGLGHVCLAKRRNLQSEIGEVFLCIR